VNYFPSFDHEASLVLGQLQNVPNDVSFLSKTPNQNYKTSIIELTWHPQVRHISISNYQPEEYYEDYFMTTTYSSSMQDLQKSQVRKFVELSHGRNLAGSFIEIGCGDGSFLNNAKDYFTRVVGIEPSVRFAEAARLNSHEVILGYVTGENMLTEERFDFFASRQVFEHLPDPLDCLIGIRKMLSVGAIGLIEVPNGYAAFRGGRYFEFFPDHVNYYSVNSLVALASAAGFNVISCGESFGGDYLELWVSLDQEPNSYFNQMQNSQSKVISTIRGWNQHHELKVLNVLFGCGAKTLSIIAREPDLFENCFSFAIDSDPNKIGKYIPNTSIEIVALNDPRLLNAKNFWIFALSYVDEIAKMISSEYPQAEDILTFDRTLDTVSLKSLLR
jgi:SAM-dependent methyltransferase